MMAKLQPAILAALNTAIRRLLPRDWDFSLIAWRTKDDEIELTMVAQGNPDDMMIAMRECMKDVSVEQTKATH